MLQGSILQKLETAHRHSKRPLNFGVYYKNTLVSLCHALEDFILESGGKPLTIAAFQRGKWYLQEAERYSQLAEKSSQVAIMAAPDTGFAEHSTSQLKNVSLVSLDPADPVAQEWHLIIMSETYTAMVLCQELSESDYGVKGVPESDRDRKFYGFWTFEPELVRETIDLAIAHIGNYNRDLQQTLGEQAQQITAAFGTTERDDIGIVVSRVVDYLQSSQHNLYQTGEDQLHTLPIEDKVLDDNLLSNEMQAFLRMAQLIDQADATNPMAASEVAALCEAMGQLLDLPAWQLKRLRLAGLLHRLIPMQGVEDVLDAPKSPVQKEVVGQKESLPKASVLRIMPQLQAIAHIVTHQTEHWQGSGKPDGLAYDAIPLESRILALIADFQQRVATYQSQDNSLARALSDCRAKAGTVFDPKLVEALELLTIGMQQGMSLQVNQPKIAAGMWLIDSHSSE
ncbi:MULTISPECIES: DICT sensory domain-containing protein [unclassified Coleofasciculus]|uniref:DICT sensory domain-containing protein n=1 Tax=unclassified Coleofasciculus TaxID=2692782 RepID=UPI001881BC29|nr:MULTISPECIES: DICT sensory domain-containing protein [unclassified Coleofasciculus]MBE9127837.1 metal-dependent phosphohydrolase [Coleofasciculus sp. LEGE 07081]MBE9148081.1 metal-dependent phosphohydrolase [Coleofasciculus sp. LEGE 07092]